MATVIDTRKYEKRLPEAGASEPLTDAIIDTLVDSRAADLTQLVTKDDLRVAIAELRADLLKWMVPLMSGQLLALIALAVGLFLRG